MFLNEAMKPLAVVAVVLMLATGAALAGADGDQPAPPQPPDKIALDATPPPEDAEPPATVIAGAPQRSASAPPQPKITATLLAVKTWKVGPDGLVVDWETGKPLSDEELEKRIREFYANLPEDKVRSRSALFEIETRYTYWGLRAQELSSEAWLLEKEIKENPGEATEEQWKQVSKIRSEADLARANAIEHERNLRRLLAAKPGSANAKEPAESTAAAEAEASGIDNYKLQVGQEVNFDVSNNSDPRATVGSIVMVRYTRPKVAINGPYDERRGEQCHVDHNGVIHVTLPDKPQQQMMPMVWNATFIVDGLTQPEIQQAIATALEERGVELDNFSVEVRNPPAKKIESAAAAEAETTGIDDYKLRPGQRIGIEVLSAEPEPAASVTGDYQIERFGTVALGASWGRVEVAGLSVVEAEAALKKRLLELTQEDDENIAVQITEAPASTLETQPAAAEPQPPTQASNDIRLAPDDVFDLAIWSGDGSLIVRGKIAIDSRGWLKVAPFGETVAAGLTLTELQRSILDLARNANPPNRAPNAQVRLMHDRFGVVGGADPPTGVPSSDDPPRDPPAETPSNDPVPGRAAADQERPAPDGGS